MEKDLKMEVFASVDTVKPVEFHVYELHVQKIGNTYSIIRGVAWKLRNWNQAGVFEDGNKIYATEKLQEKIPNADFTVEYEGSRELPVLENRRIYQELIKYWITQKLSQILIFGKYRKYSCKSNVTSKWIMSNHRFLSECLSDYSLPSHFLLPDQLDLVLFPDNQLQFDSMKKDCWYQFSDMLFHHP